MAALKKVLIIDDEKDFCYFVKRNLETSGEFEVFTANEGSQGIELIRLKHPDIILLDIVMPGMTGPDIAAYLLNDPETKDTPFIFLTAIVTKNELGGDSMKEIKGHPFIQKPVETKTLLTSIRTVLQRSQQDKQISNILAGKHA